MVGFLVLVVFTMGVCVLTYYALMLARLVRHPRALDGPSTAMVYGANLPACKVPNHCINTCLYFREMPTRDAVLQLLRDIVDRYPPFRSLPVPAFGGIGLLWEECPIDAADHLIESSVSSEDDLTARLYDIIRVNIQGHPKRLWEVHYVATTGTGRGLLIFRIEHCIGDGLSLAQLFGEFTTDEAGQRVEMPVLKRPSKGHAPVSAFQWLCRLISGLRAVHFMTDGPADSPTPFCPSRGALREFCPKQVVVRFPRHSLQLVKDIKAKAGVTVNDVVFCCIAGSLRRYLEAQGVELQSVQQLRAMVPIAFPKPGGLGNRWTFISADLPVGAPTAEERLRRTAATMNGLKASLAAPILLFFSAYLSRFLPHRFTQRTTSLTMSRHSCVASNVPGPDRAVKICGAVLDEIDVVYPNLLPQICIVSYNGEMFGNIVVDPDVVKDPQALGGFYIQELQELAAAFSVA